MPEDRDAKVLALIEGLVRRPADLALVKQALDAAGYGLLCQVEKAPFPRVTDPVRLANARHGIILDTETTGLKQGKDKVVQLSMLRFTFDDQGILDIGAIFDKFNDPGIPMSKEASDITGITDEMVRGCKITPEEIRNFCAGVSLVVAHNAAFDRKMCEANFPGCGFASVAWHCSIEQIDWMARGKSGRSLEVIAMKNGFIYGSHNATSDILATAFVLADNTTEETPFAEMLRRGHAGMVQIIAKGSSYDKKDVLKENGYFWSDDGLEAGGHLKVWHKTLPNDPAVLDAEAKFLRENVYGRDMALPMFHLDPIERYSSRPRTRPAIFATAEVRNISDLIRQESGYSVPSQPMLI